MENLKRKKLYLVLDCETATLPSVSRIARNEKQKQNASIAKPLIYDIGWQVIDRQGNIYIRKSFLIREIFMTPEVFNTAYYREKRPLYLQKLRANGISLVNWNEAMEEFEKDASICYAVGAYNAMFDFKKAIPFTELYMNKQFDDDFADWLDYQQGIIKEICAGKKSTSSKEFEPDIFRFRKKVYPLFDVWGIACKKVINTQSYKKMCIKNMLLTESGQYFKTSAETAFQYITGNIDFEESHTAIEDAEIESEILCRALRKGRLEIGIVYFPFKELGCPINFLQENPRKYFDNIINFIRVLENKHPDTEIQEMNLNRLIYKLKDLL